MPIQLLGKSVDSIIIVAAEFINYLKLNTGVSKVLPRARGWRGSADL